MTLNTVLEIIVSLAFLAKVDTLVIPIELFSEIECPGDQLSHSSATPANLQQQHNSRHSQKAIGCDKYYSKTRTHSGVQLSSSPQSILSPTIACN